MNTKRYLPEDLYAKFKAMRDAVTLNEFYNRPMYQKTQEIGCAAQFGRAFSSNVSPCFLLVADRDTQTDVDFHLEVAGNIYPFQITESQAPGRRRGEEYKNEKPKGTTREEWRTGTEQGPCWVRKSIQKKYDHYGGNVTGLNLLVYVNFPAYEHDYEEMCQFVGELAARFASIWLLDGSATCCIGGSGVLGEKRPWQFIQ